MENPVERSEEIRREKKPIKAAVFARFIPAVVLFSALASACAAKESQEPTRPAETPTSPPIATETIPAGLPTSFAEPSPTRQIVELTETPEIQASIFDQLRTKIEKSQAEDKEELLAVIEKFEKVDGVLTEFQTAYESYKEPDGTPTLLALKVKSLDNLDPSPLYPGLTPEEARRAWVEDNIFYLNHEELLRDTIQTILTSEGMSLSQINAELSKTEGQLDRIPYLEADSQRGFALEIETEGVEVSQGQIDKIRQEIEKLPLAGKLKVILTTRALNQQNRGTELPLAYFETPTTPQMMVIPVDGPEQAIMESIHLEGGHLVQISANSYPYVEHLSPQEFVELQIRELEALGPENVAGLLSILQARVGKDPIGEIMEDAQWIVESFFSDKVVRKAIEDPSSPSAKYLQILQAYLNN
jgi:hypothetical protein